jgi:NADPH-dependent curcumin reductase CurA
LAPEWRDRRTWPNRLGRSRGKSTYNAGCVSRFHLRATLTECGGSPLSAVNHKFELAARPTGLPKPTDWNYKEEAVREPAEGEVLVRVIYISLDPAMRGWMNDRRSYIPPVAIGEVMRALGLGKVVASLNPKFAPGDYVYGPLGVQEYAMTKGGGLAKVDAAVAPLPVCLSALGMPGLTAYFGLMDIGRPQPGETVVVSGAAGAVGAVVGQIARIKGCRAVGIAGGAEKCRYLREDLGFDAAIDYKTENVYRRSSRIVPRAWTFTSTTWAAKCWRQRWRSWRAMAALPSAARSPNTTARCP